MDVLVTISRRAYDFYTRPKKSGGAGLNKAGLISYLDQSGGYLGKVVGIRIDNDADGAAASWKALD